MDKRVVRPGRALARASLVMAAVLTAASCVGSSEPTRSSDKRQSQSGGPVLTDRRPCPEQSDVTCADLLVPLDRTGKVSGTLRLQVAALGDDKAPRGTLLFLTGGPGQPGVPYVPALRKQLPKALAEYRLVVIDQRGTGGTAVDCPQLQREVGSSDTVPPTAAAVRACAGALGDRRNFYTTADTVADLEDLRSALGVASWAVDGVSYGTFTGGQYALTHPNRVTRLVLDSVVPLDGAGALYEASLGHAAWVLRTACREQSCGFDPAKDLATVVRRDGNGMGVFNLLVVASIIDPRLSNPEYGILDAIHESAGGDPDALKQLVEGFLDAEPVPKEYFSSGLHAATLCADTPWPWGDADVPEKGRQEALTRAVQGIEPAAVWPFEPRTAAEQGIPETCLPWPPSRPDRTADPATKLTMPVLLLAGDRDLSTPPAWARAVAAAIPQARLAMIKGAGHATQSRSDKGAKAAEAFLLQ